MLLNSYILSAFNYCPIVWMFCSKALNNMINRTHKRALRITYNLHNETFENLLETSKSQSIHSRNIVYLLTEVFKTFNNENPKFLQDMFLKKETTYDLRSSNLLTFPWVEKSRHGLNGLIFRSTLLWNSIPDSIKNLPNTKSFKANLSMASVRIKCTCNLCKF